MSNRWQELPINPSPKVGNAKHVGLLLSMLHPATLLFVEVKPCRFLFLREPEKEETKTSNTASGPKRKRWSRRGQWRTAEEWGGEKNSMPAIALGLYQVRHLDVALALSFTETQGLSTTCHRSSQYLFLLWNILFYRKSLYVLQSIRRLQQNGYWISMD